MACSSAQAVRAVMFSTQVTALISRGPLFGRAGRGGGDLLAAGFGTVDGKRLSQPNEALAQAVHAVANRAAPDPIDRWLLAADLLSQPMLGPAGSDECFHSFFRFHAHQHTVHMHGCATRRCPRRLGVGQCAHE